MIIQRSADNEHVLFIILIPNVRTSKLKYAMIYLLRTPINFLCDISLTCNLDSYYALALPFELCEIIRCNHNGKKIMYSTILPQVADQFTIYDRMYQRVIPFFQNRQSSHLPQVQFSQGHYVHRTAFRTLLSESSTISRLSYL